MHVGRISYPRIQSCLYNGQISSVKQASRYNKRVCAASAILLISSQHLHHFAREQNLWMPPTSSASAGLRTSVARSPPAHTQTVSALLLRAGSTAHFVQPRGSRIHAIRHRAFHAIGRTDAWNPEMYCQHVCRVKPLTPSSLI